MKSWLLGIFAALGLLASSPALAQGGSTNDTVVSACGTPYNTPVVGQQYPGTQNTNLQKCTAGSASISGTTSNATSGVAPSSTNLPSVAYNYWFNGTTWDQAQDDASKNLKVTAINAGTFAVQDGASATGGATPVSILSANSTNATNVKNGAGTLYHISVQNNSTTAVAYLIFFNTATTPTCTGTPYYGPILIPYVGSTGNNGSGVIEDIAVGLNFSTGISYCLTAAAAGTGSVAANAISGGLGYK